MGGICIFTLVRKIDLNYTTNRIIVIISLLVAGTGYLITKDMRSSLYLGGGTFLTWALAREVDPKHEYSAFLCAAISLINIFYYKNIELLIIFWILLLIRIVSAITGKKITIVDVLSVVGLSIFLSISNQNIVYLIPCLLAVISLMIFNGKIKISLAFLSKISTNFLSVNGVIDDKGNPADVLKIRASQLLFLITILLLFLFSDVGFNNAVIYISVIVGVTLYSLKYMFKKISS